MDCRQKSRNRVHMLMPRHWGDQQRRLPGPFHQWGVNWLKGACGGGGGTSRVGKVEGSLSSSSHSAMPPNQHHPTVWHRSMGDRTWRRWKQRLPTDGRIKRMWCVHTHNRILLNQKKERNNAVCSNTDGTRGYHTKWSISGRESQVSYDTIYRWNLKYDTK